MKAVLLFAILLFTARLGLTQETCSTDEGLKTRLQQSLAPCHGGILEIVVPSAPSGNTDMWARNFQAYLRTLDVLSLVINRPGGSQTVGAVSVARAGGGRAAHGASTANCRILVAQKNTLGWNHFIITAPVDRERPNLEPLRDFKPIALLGETPLLLVVPENSPLYTYEDFKSKVLRERQDFIYGANGRWGVEDLAMIELLDALEIQGAGVNPYKGSSEVTRDLIAGWVEVAFQTPLAVVKELESGRIRALAMTQPLPGIELPVIDEPEFGPEAVKSMWIALVGNQSMTEEMAEDMNHVANCFLMSPRGRKLLKDLHYEALGGSRLRLREAIQRENEKWRKILPSLRSRS